MTDRQQVETTYADLRPDDLVVDKTGKAWPIADVEKGDPVSVSLVEFWLCDPTSKVKQHLMRKTPGDTVAVSRILSHADEAAKLEADFPKSTALVNGEVTAQAGEAAKLEAVIGAVSAVMSSGEDTFTEMAEALRNVATIAEPEPLVEYTATEYDAANTATNDQPVRLPAFESMTPLEQRSHLYLLHGCFAHDAQSRDTLSTWHNELHSPDNKVKSKAIPHVHAPLADANSRG